MDLRLTLHIIDGDSRSRAEQARTAFALGHHAEVYSDLAEFVERSPSHGVVLLRQRALDRTLDELFESLDELGVWLPTVICSEDPQLERVVSAIKHGALDYLQLPLEAGRLARSLARVIDEADAQGRARRRLADARRRVSALSKREREVLELLALGSSNKSIARELSISPRTVEIHRGNMMTKLRVGHAAEAVRVWLQSGLESPVPTPVAEEREHELRGLVDAQDYARAIRRRMPELVEEDEADLAGDAAPDKRSRRARRADTA